MYEITMDLFIDVLNRNGINVTGGVIHEYIRNCYVDVNRHNEWELFYLHKKGKNIRPVFIGASTKPIKLEVFGKLEAIG